MIKKLKIQDTSHIQSYSNRILHNLSLEDTLARVSPARVFDLTPEPTTEETAGDRNPSQHHNNPAESQVK